ncbi:hypothetical protein MMYC01_205626 [Madurella mycetomatis]|uniref:Rhodopsin domain-containing protein n=1 Tax=Madurella mycetomatis TaxID=100816 RepID=A0A175W6H5_9PEZI|nr:hypothetical protein MMYC01_205626 [Madurella mycetomatis]
MAAADDVGSLPRASLLALIWASFSAAFLFAMLRAAIRFKVSNRPTTDDLWILLALSSLLTLCILETIQLPSLYYITGVTSGVLPISQELISQTEDYLKLEFPIIILFWTVLWSVKAGFLALYFKLCRELVIYRRIWYALAGFTFLAYVGCIVTLIVSCGSFNNLFEFGKCGNPESVWASNFSVYYSTTIDVFTDLCIMAMPLKLIYNLNISRKQKAGLACIFGLSFVMIAFAIIRAKQVLVPQYFVNLTMLMVWSTLAASIAIVVGCMPALKIFLTNRAATKRSRNDSAGTGRRQQFSKSTSIRSKSVPLGSISSESKSANGRGLERKDSQEEMLRPETGNSYSQFVLVQQDFTVSYSEVDRPSHGHEHPSVSSCGRAV